MAAKHTGNSVARRSIGRPTAINDIVLGKLQEAFAYDSSIEEACFYADINPDTYYVYVKKNPAFSERVKALRQRPILAARQKIVKDIETNVDTAKWYLERKRKSEFSTKTETDTTLKLVTPILGGIVKESVIDVHSDDNNS